ncbi:uncharacterized protein Gasu_21790 [Galdieria sulphuraria]|uniref:Uncharacterized protein n=1 Tax=Galdieria sulphuraria TaxID=130081 RepID=M2W430_GALSU|nr:uncharacterized protein Gasu_21790 [Galdieria sulphuraria]EME30506.1 hypothetical protein Gasu_21790 [Galdieria sulphuraria]|eukprot:XP_005707026.1 hypothetical protein Gasu_21790 [Galdieria sulphuraria]
MIRLVCRFLVAFLFINHCLAYTQVDDVSYANNYVSRLANFTSNFTVIGTSLGQPWICGYSTNTTLLGKWSGVKNWTWSSEAKSNGVSNIAGATAFNALKNKTVCVQGDGNSRQFYHALVEILSNHSSAIPVNKNGNDFCNAPFAQCPQDTYYFDLVDKSDNLSVKLYWRWAPEFSDIECPMKVPSGFTPGSNYSFPSGPDTLSCDINIMDAGQWELFEKDANVTTAGYSQGVSNLSKCFSSDKSAKYFWIAAYALTPEQLQIHLPYNNTDVERINEVATQGLNSTACVLNGYDVTVNAFNDTKEATTDGIHYFGWINEQVVQLFFNAVTNSSAPTVPSSNVSVTSPNVQLGQVPNLNPSTTNSFLPVQTIVTVPSSSATSASSGLNFGGSSQGGGSGIPQL